MNFQPKLKEVEMKNMVKNICAAMVINLCAAGHLSATENNPTKFLRDYLTIKQQLQRPVRLSNIYFEWKKYMDGHDRKQEMVEMLDYARYYQQVTEAQMETSKLSAKMRHICNIESLSLIHI